MQGGHAAHRLSMRPGIFSGQWEGSQISIVSGLTCFFFSFLFFFNMADVLKIANFRGRGTLMK